MEVGFIKLVNKYTWLSPMVIVPNKKGKLCLCIDYHKLNVGGKKVYSFMDRFKGYNQISLALEAREYTTFIME